MSQILSKNKDYIQLLVTTPSRTQATALLDTCTNNQIDAIANIAKNLLRLPLTPAARIIVSKRKGLLHKLSPSSGLTYRTKARLIGKHYRLILEVLSFVKKPLLELINLVPDTSEDFNTEEKIEISPEKNPDSR